MHLPSPLRATLATTLAALLFGCAGSTPPASTCPEPEVSSAAPLLRGTYVITRITGSDGTVLTADEMPDNLDVEGSRLSLTFDEDSVGVELILITEMEADVSTSASHRLFVVSTCSASVPALFRPDAFVLPVDLRAVGTASAIMVDRSIGDDGRASTRSQWDRERCSASLDADTFTIVEQGPPTEEGRPSRVVLRYGENQGATMELEAALPLEDLDLADFAEEAAASGDDEAAGAPN